MFAEVILHRRVPSRFESFTYEVPADMKVTPGQIVRVPFRKQTLSAIVRKIHNAKPLYPTKTLSQISHTILTREQIALSEWMSAHYHCPFSKVIDLFIPEKIWK
jgi:primosomal protein N'